MDLKENVSCSLSVSKMSLASSPGGKKRKLPASFEATSLHQKVKATVRIQRFIRLRWRLAKNLDPFSLQRIPMKFLFVLTEASGGVQHCFDARHFATYALTTGCFNNPLSRRALRSWEVEKLVLMQARAVRHVLRATYACRDALQRFYGETEGMDMVSDLTERLDVFLQDTLAVAERNFFDFSLPLVEDKLDAYEDLLGQLQLESEKKARALRARHKSVIAHRGVLCPFELVEEIKEIHSSWDEQDERRAGDCAHPTPLLKEWALRRLRFR